jgi:hypothetical protein
MCVSIKLKLDNHVLTLIPCYFPHSGYKDDELDLFAQGFVHFYSSSTPTKKSTIIIGAVINASIGNRNTGKILDTPSTNDMKKIK